MVLAPSKVAIDGGGSVLRRAFLWRSLGRRVGLGAVVVALACAQDPGEQAPDAVGAGIVVEPFVSMRGEAAADGDALALARRGGPGVLGQLLDRAGADEGSSETIRAAGLLGAPAFERASAWSTAEDWWWSRYATETDPAARDAWRWVLARHGGPRSQARWAAELGSSLGEHAPSDGAAVLRSIGIACARGVPLREPGVAAVHLGLLAGDARADAAAYGLARCAGISGEALAGFDRFALVGALASRLGASPDAGAGVWKALRALGERLPGDSPLDAPTLAAKPSSALERGAQIERVRAWAAHPDRQRDLLVWLVGHDEVSAWSAPLVLEALRSLRPYVARHPEWIALTEPWRRRFAAEPGLAATHLACELEVWRAIVEGGSARILACGDRSSDLPATWRDVQRVEALYHGRERRPGDGSTPIELLIACTQDGHPAVVQAALSALTEVDDLRVNAILRRSLAAGDVGIRTAAAGAVARRAEQLGRRDPDAVAALEALIADRQVALLEARILAVRALGRLGRSDTSVPAWLLDGLLPLATDPYRAVQEEAYVALARDPDAQQRFVAAIPERDPSEMPPPPSASPVGLEFALERGGFVVRLDHLGAPQTVAQFVRWAQAGLFDGTRFHRVIPGFIVQGGDPRGDGYGSGEIVLPNEVSLRPFVRGTVGIASVAGPHAGGSQFFIVTSDQPHLDGRFTILGSIDEAGLEIVDAVLPFESIRTVRLWSEVP